MDIETYKNYLRDLIYLMKEYIDKQITDDDFSNGVKQGYSEVLDLIENQADAFGIDLNEIGFNDYDKYEGKN